MSSPCSASAPCDSSCHTAARAASRAWRVVLRVALNASGWVTPSDLIWTVSLAAIQHRHGVCGSVGEIGVHHGAFFSVLAATAVGGERLFACDVFEEGQRAGFNVDHSGRGSRSRFFGTLRLALGAGFDPERELALAPYTSLRLHDEEARQTDAWTMPRFRMLSVDGGHIEVVAFSDLRWAAGRLAPGGLVAVDDAFSPAWPGVSRALRDFFHLFDRKHERLRPLLATTKKIYLTTPSHHSKYLHAICELSHGSGHRLLQEYGGGDDLPHPKNSSVWHKVSTVPIDFIGHMLMLTEPPVNGSRLDPVLNTNARGLAKRWEREQPMVGVPKPHESYSVAVSKEMMRFLAGTVSVNAMPPGVMQKTMKVYGRCNPSRRH
ncbi:hypothetical protein AB1Y20_021584 [Prymnesium parvum]|uniref:Class I SAM-dependent methyltransferase n=1 Tax=Prymnesium parvum TaxID=97485 RepID=A0AB34JKK9_PRYPA